MIRWPPRPSLTPTFYKGHGLGNDYLVFEEGSAWLASPENVSRVCDRHRGIGGDGIVVRLHGVDPSRQAADPHEGFVDLRMFNPDGGEFERSGNGLRILGSYVARERPGLHTLRVRVGGDELRMVLHGCDEGVHDVAVEMGRARLGPEAVALDEGALDVDGRLPWGETSVDVVPVSMGNPHLVVLADPGTTPSEAVLHGVGPFLATHPALAVGANVQLAAPIGDRRCAALIWERGVGPTASSGTSACAVAVALVSRGLLEAGEITVEMPGGELRVGVDPDLGVVLRGPVEEVCHGTLTDAVIASMARPG